MRENTQQLENGGYTDKNISISDMKVTTKSKFEKIDDTPFIVGVDEERGPVAAIGSYIVYVGESVEEVKEEIDKVNWHLVLNSVIAYNNMIYEVNKIKEEE